MQQVPQVHGVQQGVVVAEDAEVVGDEKSESELCKLMEAERSKKVLGAWGW